MIGDSAIATDKHLDWLTVARGSHDQFPGQTMAGIILGMSSANERRRYNVTPPLIGRAHTQNDPCHVITESAVTINRHPDWSNVLCWSHDQVLPRSVVWMFGAGSVYFKPVINATERNKKNIRYYLNRSNIIKSLHHMITVKPPV